jgi:hypothetical protein
MELCMPLSVGINHCSVIYSLYVPCFGLPYWQKKKRVLISVGFLCHLTGIVPNYWLGFTQLLQKVSLKWYMGNTQVQTGGLLLFSLHPKVFWPDPREDIISYLGIVLYLIGFVLNELKFFYCVGYCMEFFLS